MTIVSKICNDADMKHWKLSGMYYLSNVKLFRYYLELQFNSVRASRICLF